VPGWRVPSVARGYGIHTCESFPLVRDRGFWFKRRIDVGGP
jgi:hypothetical protein